MSAYLSDEWVAELNELLRAVTAPVDAPPLVVQYEVTQAPGGDRRWYLALQPGTVQAVVGAAAAPDVTFVQDWPVAVAIQLGQRAAPEALLSGDVRVSGNPTTLLPWTAALRHVEAALAELSGRTQLLEPQG
ncbi:MAG: sterol transfer family [Acidimicrobiia bacterium]|jgi:hypothetical protein|nr:sterol transfer family [Acidimicrobiia bacterium]